MTCRILPYSARVVKLTNHDFLSLGWKIAIGLLSTSALAALKIWLTASLEHHLESNPEGTLGGISYVFSLCFVVLLKHLRFIYSLLEGHIAYYTAYSTDCKLLGGK